MEIDNETKAQIAESCSNYVRGRSMALSFKPLTLQDVRDAYKCGAEDMQRLIDDTDWWKTADGENLPEIDREVIALTTEGKIVFAHRPVESYIGKDIFTGKKTKRVPKRFGKGQWNMPDILYWLDIQIPQIEIPEPHRGTGTV